MSGNRFSGVMNVGLISNSRMAESGFCICLETPFAKMRCAYSKGGSGIMVWGFFVVCAEIQINGKYNTDSYSTVLDNKGLPTLQQFYGLNHCYLQDDNATYHIVRSTMDWYDDNGVCISDWIGLRRLESHRKPLRCVGSQN
ncbi:hypothetical protein TNCV_3422241 [Trichonephila clavipes]|nr:hypothetical protein TNCV_3422241 [Trichonephila clavipes]